ncbi:MAG: hypothetical protein HY875_07175 [Chloroflexi bacterium]|nr:hypothetical protein [Chloroflexota bacterium]
MNSMVRCAFLLAVGGLMLLASACDDFAQTAPGGGEASPDVKATLEATYQAGRPPTPTAVPPSVGRCPAGVDQAVCDLAVQLRSQIGPAAIDQLPLAPVTITCPDAERWVFGTEPQCSKDKAGKPQEGYFWASKLFQFVDEAVFRSYLKAWQSSPYKVAGIGCARASETSALDCSGAFVIVMGGEPHPGQLDAFVLLVRRSAAGATVFGALAFPYVWPEAAVSGGWLGVGLADLADELPERVWVYPWKP